MWTAKEQSSSFTPGLPALRRRNSPEAKARRICFLAARDADRFEKAGVPWEDGYGRSMLANYADFRADEAVYLAVVEYETAPKAPQ